MTITPCSHCGRPNCGQDPERGSDFKCIKCGETIDHFNYIATYGIETGTYTDNKGYVKDEAPDRSSIIFSCPKCHENLARELIEAQDYMMENEIIFGEEDAE